MLILFHEQQVQLPRPSVPLWIEQNRFRVHSQGRVEARTGRAHICAQPDAICVHRAQHGVMQRRPPLTFILRRSALVHIPLPVPRTQVRKAHQFAFRV